MVQNHALEMLAFVLMEIPKDADVISYPAARANALDSLIPVDPAHARQASDAWPV